MNYDPHAVFPEFYGNHIIRKLAALPRWTVLDSEQVPINVRELLSSGRVLGVHEIDADSLMTLDELTTRLPQAANCAFYLHDNIDQVALLTITDTCPQHLVHEIYQSGSLYSEYRTNVQASQHLLPAPMVTDSFPSIANRKRLTERHGWYEIVLEGWVVFSRHTLPTTVAPIVSDPHAARPTWDRLFRNLSLETRASRALATDIRIKRPKLRRVSQLLDSLTQTPLEIAATDFQGDLALFEYEVLHELHARLRPILKVVPAVDDGANLSPSAEAWLIAEAAKHLLPHRSPSINPEDASPLLLDAAASVVLTRPVFTDTSTT